MEINKEELEKLIAEKYNGKYKRLADDLGIDYSTMWRILNGKAKPGQVFIGKFMTYSKSKKIGFAKYFKESEQIKQ